MLTPPTSAAGTPTSQPSNIPVPASRYTMAELADIYNAARVDYIVPMPMNAKRMQDYVTAYDVDLNLSLVAIDSEDQQPNGIGMLGVRDTRGWITRLGVIPERRRRRTGEFLMNEMITQAQHRHLKIIQLEVIKGNDPAYALFKKVGFEDVRELLIIRRPPGRLKTGQLLLPTVQGELVEETQQIRAWLDEREGGVAWLEETTSLLNAGNLKAMVVTLPNGESGWIVFQQTAFLLTHFVMKPAISDELRLALITSVHQQYAMQDTRIENLPIDDPTLPAYQQLGYVEAFRRNEMVLYLP